jgi:hypothetical protein
MHFEPQGTPAEMEVLLRRFVSITGWGPWRARLRSLEEQVKDNHFLDEYFEERFPLELEMAAVHRVTRHGGKLRLPTMHRQAAFFGLVATVARVHQRLSPGGQARLEGMLRDGLKADHGLAPLQHEMLVVSHLMSRGFNVSFSDMETGGGFDFLAERNGAELEVEAKTFSGDLGRKVHQRRLYQLGKHMHPAMSDALDRRPGGQLVRIVLPARLQGAAEQMQEISERLVGVLNSGTSDPGPVTCAIEFKEFSLEGSPFQNSRPEALEREAARSFVEKQAGFPIRNVVMLMRPNHGAVVVTVESTQKDAVMKSLVRELKRSVKGQLTGKRPAVIAVKFSDITQAQLMEIAEQDMSGQPSALQIATSQLLDREDWRNVHTIAYLTPGHLSSSRAVYGGKITSSAQDQGQTYQFRNPYHEMHDDLRFSVF